MAVPSSVPPSPTTFPFAYPPCTAATTGSWSARRALRVVRWMRALSFFCTVVVNNQSTPCNMAVRLRYPPAAAIIQRNKPCPPKRNILPGPWPGRESLGRLLIDSFVSWCCWVYHIRLIVFLPMSGVTSHVRCARAGTDPPSDVHELAEPTASRLRLGWIGL